VLVILLVLDTDDSDEPIASFLHAKGQVIMQYDGAMTETNAERYFYLHDRLGSVRQVIDESATIENCYTYDPWGLTIGDETAETVFNPYRFGGYFWEPEITQYHCFRRQYDPVLARFTSRDPVMGDFKEPLTLHAYLYCLNDPVNRIDPSGRMSMSETNTVGGIQGWLSSALTRGILHSIGGGLKTGIFEALKGKSFGKGFLTGAASEGIPAFFGLYGILGQAVGGAVGSATGSALDGDSVEKIVAHGLAGATIGTVMGGITEKAYDLGPLRAEEIKELKKIVDPLMGSLSSDVERLLFYLLDRNEESDSSGKRSGGH